MLVAKGHRFQRQDCFACLVHRLDRILVTGRRDDRAQLTVSIDYYPDTPCNGDATDTGDKSPPLLRADANGSGFGRPSTAVDIDIVTACREISPR